MRHLIVTDSDIIEAIGFELTKVLAVPTFGALEVVFKSTPDIVYRYENVDPDTLAQLISAESIGKSFHEMFRKTKHPFTKSDRQQLTLKK
jgi:hypothetical protein